jgi:hypothetical protein
VAGVRLVSQPMKTISLGSDGPGRGPPLPFKANGSREIGASPQENPPLGAEEKAVAASQIRLKLKKKMEVERPLGMELGMRYLGRRENNEGQTTPQGFKHN